MSSSAIADAPEQQATGREITYADALREAIREEMQRDPKVFIMGEDIGIHGGAFTVTKGLLEEFGKERVRNTPISEQAIVGAGVGAALTGMRPIAELMYIDFTCIAMDQIVNQAAKIRYMLGGQAHVPMVIRTQQGAGRSNAAQHSQSLEAWFFHIPGLLVAQPSTPYDAKGLLKTAIRDDNPVMFIEHKMLYFTKGTVPEGEYTVPFGVADVKRPGEDVTIVATGRMVLRALEAAQELEAEGISAEVIDPRTLVPLDMETILGSVRKTSRVVIAHEAVKQGGIGGELSARIVEEAFDYLNAPPARVAARNTPIPYAGNLEEAVLPNKQQIIDAVRGLL